jgi:FtsH-binding integral membrane protein
LLTGESLLLVVLAAPLMLVATFSGRRINFSIGERGYTMLFWAVMGGYTLRLVLGLYA